MLIKAIPVVSTAGREVIPAREAEILPTPIFHTASSPSFTLPRSPPHPFSLDKYAQTKLADNLGRAESSQV